MLIPGTLARTDQKFVVCLFKVNGHDLDYEFIPFRSEVVARVQGDLIVKNMRSGGEETRGVSAVFLQRADGSWESLGTIHDVSTTTDEVGVAK